MGLSGGYRGELAAAEAAAREAGELLLRLRGGELDVREKRDGSLVTDADTAVEEIILRRLRVEFPADAVSSEEAAPREASSGRQWVVDPLDGTTNFSRALPFFAVSIAFWERGEPAVGVVYLPALAELFSARRGEPAALNGKEISVSPVARLEEAMVNCYFDRHRLLEPGLEVFRRVALRCDGRVKIMGSTASMLCYVACGRLDAHVRNATKLWDFAAAGLILEQAGGTITDFDARPVRETGQSLLATNGRIHQELAAVVRVPPQPPNSGGSAG